MIELLNSYHLTGLVIGICTFLIIGLFHPVVVKAEYYWGTKCWWIFLLLGIVGVIASFSTEDIFLSSLSGVFAFSSFWTIKEVFEEAGLHVEPYAHLVDVPRSTSRTRYYLARRKGGTPAAMGWESQAVHLAPLPRLKELLHHPNDAPILEALHRALPALARA